MIIKLKTVCPEIIGGFQMVNTMSQMAPLL